jgi:hypothetical protein
MPRDSEKTLECDKKPGGGLAIAEMLVGKVDEPGFAA